MIKTFLKFALAIGLITWLVRSDKLNFSLVIDSFQHTSNWLFGLLFISCAYTLSGFRWKKILEIKIQKKFKYLQVLKIHWIGLLFNSVLPGAVSGDFIKLLYARDLDKDLDLSFLFTSVIMDRILGLIGLLFILGFSTLINYSELVNISPMVKKITVFNFSLFFVSLFFITCITLPTKLQNFFLDIISKIPLVGKKISHLTKQVWIIGKNIKIVCLAIGISMISQISMMLGFYFLVFPYLNGLISFSKFLSFAPIGFTAVAIPITPAGLGVGHAAFDTLFNFFHVKGGADLFNFHFIAATTLNLLGIIPYILSGKKHTVKEANELSHQESLL